MLGPSQFASRQGFSRRNASEHIASRSRRTVSISGGVPDNEFASSPLRCRTSGAGRTPPGAGPHLHAEVLQRLSATPRFERFSGRCHGEPNRSGRRCDYPLGHLLKSTGRATVGGCDTMKAAPTELIVAAPREPFAASVRSNPKASGYCVCAIVAATEGNRRSFGCGNFGAPPKSALRRSTGTRSVRWRPSRIAGESSAIRAAGGQQVRLSLDEVGVKSLLCYQASRALLIPGGTTPASTEGTRP